MTDLHLVTKAAFYAAKAHRDHRRKDNVTPYVNHLAEVAHLLAAAHCPAPVIAAGYLHDTIEDVDVTYEMLVDEFGSWIADLVVTVTDDKSLPWAERKVQQVEQAAFASPETASLKLADKISNLRSLMTAPPEGWSTARLTKYVDWAHQVVSRLPAPNPILMGQYQQIRAQYDR